MVWSFCGWIQAGPMPSSGVIVVCAGSGDSQLLRVHPTGALRPHC